MILFMNVHHFGKIHMMMMMMMISYENENRYPYATYTYLMAWKNTLCDEDQRIESNMDTTFI